MQNVARGLPTAPASQLYIVGEAVISPLTCVTACKSCRKMRTLKSLAACAQVSLSLSVGP